MLESRMVHTSLMGSNLTAQVVGGCPQGGVLSPLLWNLGVDNIVIMVQCKFAHTVRELMKSALDVVVKWAVKEGLNTSPYQTTTVPFTNRRKVEHLRPLALCGKNLKCSGRLSIAKLHSYGTPMHEQPIIQE
jgi:hypothetical protein